MLAESNPLTVDNARKRFELTASNLPDAPVFEGYGVVICAGGRFVPSAYVVVRLLRHYGVSLPIEIWHAGEAEIPKWARRAFAPWDVDFHDVIPLYPDRPESELRGWAIKPAALVKSKFRHTLFLDADCFPLRDLTFLFASDEYRQSGALFWPDDKHHMMIEDAAIWGLTGLAYQGDKEFDSGLFLIDKQRCWRELSLAHWMNMHCRFWYKYTLGDKDTFYLAWRKLGTQFCLGPSSKRYRMVMTRLFWKDGQPVADHHAGASKYQLTKRIGPFDVHLAASHRPVTKNIYDELMQRFIVRDFSLHVRFLQELAALSVARE